MVGEHSTRNASSVVFLYMLLIPHVAWHLRHQSRKQVALGSGTALQTGKGNPTSMLAGCHNHPCVASHARGREVLEGITCTHC